MLDNGDGGGGLGCWLGGLAAAAVVDLAPVDIEMRVVDVFVGASLVVVDVAFCMACMTGVVVVRLAQRGVQAQRKGEESRVDVHSV